MIYLDHHATTPLDPRVLEAMMPYLTEHYGNASSAHAAGRKAHEAVERSREQVAELVGARRGEIFFTGGATESDNLAILGVARAHTGHRRRLVTTAIEHKAILEGFKQLGREGFEVVIVGVDHLGRVRHDELEAAINDQTLLVSVQLANNEVGTIQSLEAISDLAHAKGAYVHTDAAQAVGKIPVDVNALDVDLMSWSAHKFYGPKGVGALYVRGGVSGIPIQALSLGGGQERNLRSGTVNVPGIVGFGAASELASEVLPGEAARIAELRNGFEQGLVSQISLLEVNGDQNNRLPGNSSLTIPDVDAEALIANVPALALSTGSACTSGTPEASHVLIALGKSRNSAHSTIRVGLGRHNNEREIEQAAQIILAAQQRIVLLNV